MAQTYTKIERQLLLYEIFYQSREVELEDLMRRFNVSKKTIQRDIKDIADAGLYRLKYLRKDNVHEVEGISGEISEPEGTRRYMHLKKLVRLTGLMLLISDNTDNHDEGYNFKKDYMEMFPDISERTRMRDYEAMAKIGYRIRWDKNEKRHSVEGYLYQIRDKF